MKLLAFLLFIHIIAAGQGINDKEHAAQTASNVTVQDEFDERKMVGFACFYEGRETKIVSRFGRMLEHKRYGFIKTMLQSKVPAKRFMAVLCLQYLNTLGRVTMNEEDEALVDQIKTSTELLPVCSGCVPHPGIPLKEAFDTDILWRSNMWLDRHVND